MSRLEGTELELVDLARGGDPRKVDALAERVRDRVYPYLRRVTLDEHKAEDLTQDTVLAVLNSLGNLRQTERFWSWVFTIASNLAREQVRTQIRHRTISMSAVDEAQLTTPRETADGLTEASRQELALLTQQAMSRVGERFRMVLALRFYEDLPHAAIAQVMGCTEFNARALFCRAKLVLARELKKLGVGRKGLLPALAAFGAMTLHPSAAPAATVTVSSTALAEGLLATLFTTKAKIAVALLLLVSAIGSWAFLGGGRSAASPRQPALLPPPPIVTRPDGTRTFDTSPLYIRTVCHGRCLGAKSGIAPLFELWFCFPEGVDGPHLKRFVPVDDANRERVRWTIETADMNYNFWGAPGEIHVTNARSFCSMLHTAILPTDSAEFGAFVQEIDGKMSHAMVDKLGFAFERDPATGFVIAATDTRPRVAPTCRSTVEYNPPMEANPFAYVPPQDMEVIDDRDIMHRRGWTYYRVEGRLGEEAITGTGRIPFTYAASRTQPPWLRLRIGDRLTLTDDGRRAVVQDASGQIRLARPGRSFLRGMSRPWEGFHTLDTIRRDAAAVRCRYSTGHDELSRYLIHLLPDSVISTPNHPGHSAEYLVDAQADVLVNARYWLDTDPAPACTLQFTYLQELDEQTDEFAAPQIPAASPIDPPPDDTPLWPLDLMSL